MQRKYQKKKANAILKISTKNSSTNKESNSQDKVAEKYIKEKNIKMLTTNAAGLRGKESDLKN